MRLLPWIINVSNPKWRFEFHECFCFGDAQEAFHVFSRVTWKAFGVHKQIFLKTEWMKHLLRLHDRKVHTIQLTMVIISSEVKYFHLTSNYALLSSSYFNFPSFQTLPHSSPISRRTKAALTWLVHRATCFVRYPVGWACCRVPASIRW